MNYLSDQNYLNRRNKIWREYAPFYLDYWDTLQFGFNVSMYDWIKVKQTYNNKWDKYRVLCLTSNTNVNSYEIVTVKIPNARSSYTPEELINTDGMLTSIYKQEVRLQ